MRFTHKDSDYYVDDSIDVRQGLDAEYRELLAPFNCLGTVIPTGFKWNGASSPVGVREIAPRFYRNLKSSCLHDYLCSLATNRAERKDADFKYYLMKRYVSNSSRINARVSHWGVRIGAFFGIGNSF